MLPTIWNIQGFEVPFFAPDLVGQRIVQIEEDDRAEEGGAELNQPLPNRAKLIGLAEVVAQDVVPVLADPGHDKADKRWEPEEDHEDLDGPGEGEAQAQHQKDVTKEVEEKEEEICKWKREFEPSNRSCSLLYEKKLIDFLSDLKYLHCF